MTSSIAGWLLVIVLVVVFGQALADPVMYRDPIPRPLAVVSNLNQRLASHSLQEPGDAVDPRLPIPTPQDLEAIKKVAQILVMLGQQIIPAIIGDSSAPPSHASNTVPVEDAPYDPVVSR